MAKKGAWFFWWKLSVCCLRSVNITNLVLYLFSQQCYSLVWRARPSLLHPCVKGWSKEGLARQTMLQPCTSTYSQTHTHTHLQSSDRRWWSTRDRGGSSADGILSDPEGYGGLLCPSFCRGNGGDPFNTRWKCWSQSHRRGDGAEEEACKWGKDSWDKCSEGNTLYLSLSLSLSLFLSPLATLFCCLSLCGKHPAGGKYYHTTLITFPEVLL